MKLIANIIWVILCGWVIFLEYVIGGAILCATVVGIPFGVQCFKLALLGLWPFGKKIVQKPGGGEALPTVLNILWIVFAGLEIALTHVIFAIGFALTIIGIPFAIQHAKLAAIAIMPFGHEAR